MKNTFTLFTSCIVLLFASSCAKYQVIEGGRINMISHRNIEDKDYVLLRTYAGGAREEIKKSRATTIEGAINETVKQVPGGEFLKNAKVYLIERKKKKYWAVEGDIWGLKIPEGEYNGYKIGDIVYYRTGKTAKKPHPVEAKIIAIKNANLYLIEYLRQDFRGDVKKVQVEAAASVIYKK